MGGKLTVSNTLVSENAGRLYINTPKPMTLIAKINRSILFFLLS